VVEEARMSIQQWSGVAGKRVIITGATGGIGLAAARRLAIMGAEVTIVGRSNDRAQRAAATIGRSVDILLADLSSQASIYKLAEDIQHRYPRVHVLANNAGAIYGQRQLSPDHIELTWALNHLAPFLLTTLLLPNLEASAPARVITTSSAAHYRAHIPFEDLQAEHAYTTFGFGRYGETKLANILFTRELAKRLAGTQVTANCFHPGFVGSGFNRNNGALMGIGMWISHLVARSPERGADTLVWLADSPEVSNVSGAYFMDRRQKRPSPAALDDAAGRRLWQLSETQVHPR
jgi:NAD(P)-dependent dehydrogenase (short-subunit alcohol dehydrogenase family)